MLKYIKADYFKEWNMMGHLQRLVKQRCPRGKTDFIFLNLEFLFKFY